MKTKTKKGFTLVELVIVIAVIAILAAVLIPTFSSLVNKANLSADEQAVRQMNTALAIYTAENDKPSTVIEVKKALDENLINTESMVPVTKGYAFYWDKENNKIVLVGDGKGTATNDWYILTSKEYGKETKVSSVEDMNTAIEASSNAEPALIKVNSNIETNKITISNGKSVIVDLQGQTINSNAPDNDKEDYLALFNVETGGTLTIKNGTISAKCDAVINKGGDVTLEDITITTSKAEETAIYAADISNTVIKGCIINAKNIGVGSNGGANPGARIVIIDTKIQAGNTGVFMPLNANLTIDNCEITGTYFGIYLRGCSANISNTTVSHTTTSVKTENRSRWMSGTSAPVLADIVFACGGGFGGSYNRDKNVDIESSPINFTAYATTGTYKCENVITSSEKGIRSYNVVVHVPVGGNVSVSGITVDETYNETKFFPDGYYSVTTNNQ